MLNIPERGLDKPSRQLNRCLAIILVTMLEVEVRRRKVLLVGTWLAHLLDVWVDGASATLCF
jgi:hypothetical protein